jgi:beta-1,4-N-acetylglucosaminyltransferase
MVTSSVSWSSCEAITLLTHFLSNLAASIPEAEKLRKRNSQWPPPNSGEDSYKRGLAGVMDDEMGWVD